MRLIFLVKRHTGLFIFDHIGRMKGRKEGRTYGRYFVTSLHSEKSQMWIYWIGFIELASFKSVFNGYIDHCIRGTSGRYNSYLEKHLLGYRSFIFLRDMACFRASFTRLKEWSFRDIQTYPPQETQNINCGVIVFMKICKKCLTQCYMDLHCI